MSYYLPPPPTAPRNWTLSFYSSKVAQFRNRMYPFFPLSLISNKIYLPVPVLSVFSFRNRNPTKKCESGSLFNFTQS